MSLETLKNWCIIAAARGRFYAMIVKYYFLGWSRRPRNLTIIALTEHIGDIVACEPIVKYLRRADPASYLIYCINRQYVELVRYNPNIDGILTFANVNEWLRFKRIVSPKRLYDLHIYNDRPNASSCIVSNGEMIKIDHSNYFTFGCLSEIFSQVGGLPKISDQPTLYLKPNTYYPVKPKTIVVHASSNQPPKEWGREKWVALCERILQQGYNIVEVGLVQGVPVVHRNYTNLCNALTFHEIAYVIRHAVLFIGIDSAFAHFANALNTCGIVLIGHGNRGVRFIPFSNPYRDGPVCSFVEAPNEVKDIEVEELYRQVVNRLEQCTTRTDGLTAQFREDV